MKWLHDGALNGLPKECGCIKDLFTPSLQSKYVSFASCSKCYGTRVNLRDWDCSLWIRPDTFRSVVAEVHVNDEPYLGSEPAKRFRYRLHCGLQVQTIVPMYMWHTADLTTPEQVAERHAVEYLRKSADQIGMPSRRALLMRVQQVIAAQEKAYKAASEATFKPLTGQIGNFAAVPVSSYMNDLIKDAYESLLKQSLEQIDDWGYAKKALYSDHYPYEDKSKAAGTVVPRDLKTLVPGLAKAGKVQCPHVTPSDLGDFRCGTTRFLIDLVQHLNDQHKWTRERIADWLETLDVDLSFATPNAA